MTSLNSTAPLTSGDRRTPESEGHIGGDGGSKYQKWRKKTGRILQSDRLHKILIFLIAVDATFVIIDLGYSAIRPECPAEPGNPVESPAWLEILSHCSLAITSLFLIEIPLTLWSLGSQYLNPWGPVPHAWLHLFDAVVIVTTFTLEIVLRGRGSELAGLLIILRLWRIVKLVAGITIGAGEIDEEQAEELHKTKRELEVTKAELTTSLQQISQLQRRIAQLTTEREASSTNEEAIAP